MSNVYSDRDNTFDLILIIAIKLTLKFFSTVSTSSTANFENTFYSTYSGYNLSNSLVLGWISLRIDIKLTVLNIF